MAAPFVIMVIRLHVMIMFFKCTDCQVLSTCLLPIYNQECDLNCTTADQSKPISFYKLPDAINPIAQCLGINCMVINASLTAMYSIQSTDSTTTTFRIKNLSWDEKGKWRCEYNSTQDTTDLGFAKFPDDIEYSGLSNNSDIESGTVMQITMKCLYTEIPTLVTLIYQSTGGTARSIPVTCTDTTSSCANNNFVSKLCMPIIQVGTGVVCDGNYSIEIATSVLGNEERKYSLLNGITIKCPTTQTSMEYVVGGITSTNFNVDLSSSSPINTEAVTSTSYVIVSMEIPYQTNTDNTVILAYHSTDSLSMQTLSIKSISASQTIPSTSVWNTSKSLRTDLYFQESSGLLVTSSLYDSFSPQSLNQTNFVSVETQSDNFLFESITTLSNILFTNTDSVPISLKATYSSKYSIKSAGDNSPLTVYPSSGLLRTDLFVQSSEVNLVSKFEVTNSVRLSTFSTYLESDFIDAIATTLITTNSYFLTDFSFSKTLLEDSFMQHNTNGQFVTTSNPFIASMSSSDVVTEKESEDLESYFLNYSSTLSTYSSDQYVSDTFERSINTNKGSSYLQESTITESFHSMTNLRDDVISTGDMETSLKTTTSMSDYLVIDFQSNTQILSTERYGYFVTTIQADVKSSPLEIEVSHSNTSSNFRYSILHTFTTRTFKSTSQSVVSSQINSYSIMQSYRQYESPGIELTSSYFKTSSQSTEKLQSSDTSYHISSKTPIDILSKISKNDGHLSTVNLSFSAIKTGIPAEQSVTSSITKKEFVTQATGTLSQSEYIEPGASSFTYASTESLFHDSVILYSSASDFFNLTSDIFTPSVTPVSHISSTSVYLTSTASQNVISEQTKDIIVISTASSIICFSILILLISLFAKKYRQKDKQPIDTVTDQIRWTNYIQSNKGTNKKMCSDSLDTGNSLIFPRLNTKLYSYPHHYEHNWEDI